MGKGGGKAHTPREAKDNLKSTQMMSVIDAIGEGPIEGPVKGLQSILVNKTPLTDTDGNPVIHGVTAVWRAGEQEQTPPEGFESSGAETGLGVEVTKAKPVTRTITSANIDRLRVTFGVQSLVQTTSKGDRNPSSVRILIQLQRNGRWVTEKDVTINGKTSDRWVVEQMSQLTAMTASFVLATPTETDGALFPGRIMLANTCMWTYRSDECGYTGGAVADEFDKPTTDIRKDRCSKCMRGCELRRNVGNFGGFLSINKLSQ